MTGAYVLTAPRYKCTEIREAGRWESMIFDLDDHAWADKLILDTHLYSMGEGLATSTCDVI